MGGVRPPSGLGAAGGPPARAGRPPEHHVLGGAAGPPVGKLAAKVTLKGQTLVPLAIYFADSGFAKVELALAKGKSMSDKRESSKERDAKREIDRAMRRR